MDRDVYKAMAAEEDTHWWFVGRRAVLRALIARRADRSRHHAARHIPLAHREEAA